MSLLIKALNKAEEAQAQNAKTESGSGSGLELSLSPNASNLAESSAAPIAKASAAKVSAAKLNSATSNSPQSSSKIVATSSSAAAKSAANVFSSKGVDVSKQNTTLALVAGAGLIALLAMGLYYYQFATTHDVVIPPRPLEMAQAQPQPLPPPETSTALPPQAAEVLAAVKPAPFVVESNSEAAAPAKTQAAPIKEMAKKPLVGEEEVMVAINETVMDETMPAAKADKKNRKSKSHPFGESTYSPSASMKVSKTKSESAGVNPVLMSAYEAYNAGDDANAQKLYKQVLQRDVRDVDALLGLGAIATRQGRDADANGWFAKVLELDPRNSMAQAALLDSQPQGNEANSESRIKNMLAKHPNDPNLHVALGNFYAEQNQWLAAQQSYFDAYSLNTSADNAFNLAVSLDQMGKPKLALPYYQRALEQASGNSSIDKAALEARIAAIQ